MASNPPTSSKNGADPRDQAFIREVDEEYRREEFNRLASRYGRWVLLAVGLGLAAFAGFLFWQAERSRKVEAVSEQFNQLLDKADSGATTEAVQGLQETAKGDNRTYRALSLLAQAGIATNAGDLDKAAGLLSAVADDTAAPAELRDTARLKRVRLQFYKLPPADVVKQLAPYMAADNPWFPVAGEMTALAHMKANQNDKAGPIFLRIAMDERAPVSLRNRAEQMAGMLGQDVRKLADQQQAGAEARAAALAADVPLPAAGGTK